MEKIHNYLTWLYQNNSQDGGDFVFPSDILKPTYYVTKLPPEEGLDEDSEEED